MAIDVEDKSNIGKQLYSISFPTVFIGKPNIMLIYADAATYSFIGKGLVE